MRERMVSKLQSHEWIVAVTSGEVSPNAPSPDEVAAHHAPRNAAGETVLGYAHAGTFNPKQAYDWTFETTIYLAPGGGGHGVGSALYRELLERMQRRGFHTAIALVALPNPGSVALHERFGFENVGTLRHTGFKLGSWQDVRFYQKLLVADADAPPAPLIPPMG